MILNGAEWAPGILPILIEHKCRCGIISISPFSLKDFIEKDIPVYNANLENYWDCLGDAVEQLVLDGAQKIVYFGRSSTDISKRGKTHFIETCKKWKITFSEEQYILFDPALSGQEVLDRLGEVYRATQFDGLIFDSNFYYEFPPIPDFFGTTGIPRSTKMVIGFSELLKNPDLPSHTRILYRPQKKISMDIAEFLLSGKNGQITRHYKYEFPFLREIL